MKALTLKHPWVYAICELSKRIENRTWSPGRSQLCRGEMFAIHGGKTPVGFAATYEASADLDWIIARGLCPRGTFLPQTYRAGIVAVCRFGGTMTASFDPWFAGPVGWFLEDVTVLPEPVPCRGDQKLWEVPPDVLAEVERQLRGLNVEATP